MSLFWRRNAMGVVSGEEPNGFQTYSGVPVNGSGVAETSGSFDTANGNTLYMHPTINTWKYVIVPLIHEIPLSAGDVFRITCQVSAGHNGYSGCGLIDSNGNKISLTENATPRNFKNASKTVSSDCIVNRFFFFPRNGTLSSETTHVYSLAINDNVIF